MQNYKTCEEVSVKEGQERIISLLVVTRKMQQDMRRWHDSKAGCSIIILRYSNGILIKQKMFPVHVQIKI